MELALSIFIGTLVAGGVYLLCAGSVKLATYSEDGKAIILRIAQPGEILGLSAVISAISYEKTAQATDDCVVGFIKRRDFLKTFGAATTLAIAKPYAFSSTAAADSSVEILLNEPIGTVNPNLYSHFVEHLGGVVYDGIWDGEKSKIPNIGGIRKALVDSLVKLKPGVIRYPGGCFADQYDWRAAYTSRRRDNSAFR